MSGEFVQETSTGQDVYVLPFSPTGKFWTGSAFESYATASRSTYAVDLTEQGTASGIYIGDFPTTITAAGSYGYIGYRQLSSGTYSESDPRIGGGTVDWTGSASAGAATGGMTGSDWRDYVLRGGFKRTDKDTELYEITTDTIQRMRRRFMFSEAQTEKSTTDTISTLGDFKLTIESDFGMIVGLIVEDGTNAYPPMVGVSKQIFDKYYPDINVSTHRGIPVHYTIYADQIYLGPIPDSTSYNYRISYSKRAGTVTSSTSSVPFTNLYREILRDGVLSGLWRGLDQYERADYFESKFNGALKEAFLQEDINSRNHAFSMRINN